MRTMLFWAITWQVTVIPYQHFRTIKWSFKVVSKSWYGITTNLMFCSPCIMIYTLII